MSPRTILLTCLLFACSLVSETSLASAVLAQFPLDAQHLKQWKLPGRLKEISGLAISGDNRLYAHNDESATIYELDHTHGKIVSEFRLGKVRDDFEGIAVVNEQIYLLSSTGTLYRSPIGENGTRTRYKKFETGLEKNCEFEGLTYQAKKNALLLLCKTPYKKKRRHQLQIYSWSLDTLSIDKRSTLRIDDTPILTQLQSKHVLPSGITIDVETGNLLLVAAEQKALIELNENGTLIHVMRIPLHNQHHQPEGIALSTEGLLFIADEGGNQKARLSIYSNRDNPPCANNP